MTFQDKLREKSKTMVNLAELPSELQLIVIGEPEFKQDARGNEGCYIRFQMKDERQFKQKYTATTYEELATALEGIGGLESAQKTYHTWIKKRIGRTQFERYYPKPTEQATQKKVK